jgi:acetyltransferase-like isoleucine patch superfamily enzyme
VTALVHPTAIVEDGVSIGADSAIWDSVHVRGPSEIGSNCIIGEKTYVAYGVRIGDLVKINAGVYVCTGVTIEDGAMISAGVIFTNDRFPRATDPELTSLRASEPDEHTERTLVRTGATIGSGAVIGPGLTLGRFSMIGMGSVVTSAVGDFELVVGNPARVVGHVCRCGSRLEVADQTMSCPRCGRSYRMDGAKVVESS